MSKNSLVELNSVRNKPLIKEALLLLNICGVNPYNRNWWSKIKFTAIILILNHLNIELLLQFFFNWNGWESVESFTEYTALTQMIYKATFLFVKRKQFLALLNQIEQFWSWDDLESSFRDNIQYISDLALKATKLFLAFALSAVFTYALKPLLANDRTLPFNTYHPTDRRSKYYPVMYIMHILEGATGCFCIATFDTLFISFVVHIICQMRILKRRFLEIKVNTAVNGDDESSLVEINHLIHHHNVVLKCVKELDGIYTTVILNQFGSSVTCMCAVLLCMVALGFPPDLNRLAKYVPFMSAVMFQLLTYCLIGTFLMEETQSVAQAVYEADWSSKTQPKLRRACALVIQRAQKGEALKAGGVFPLNLESFTVIVKFGLSFLTLAQGVYTRTTQT